MTESANSSDQKAEKEKEPEVQAKFVDYEIEPIKDGYTLYGKYVITRKNKSTPFYKQLKSMKYPECSLVDKEEKSVENNDVRVGKISIGFLDPRCRTDSNIKVIIFIKDFQTIGQNQKPIYPMKCNVLLVNEKNPVRSAGAQTYVCFNANACHKLLSGII